MFILCLIKDISISETPSDIILQSTSRKLTFQDVKSGLKRVFKTLSTAGGTFLELSSIVKQDGSVSETIKFYYYLQKLIKVGWICHSVMSEGVAIASAMPMVEDYEFSLKESAASTKYLLDRFAYIHQVNGQMILESPLSKAQIILYDWRSGAALAQLAQPYTYSELSAKIPGLTEETSKNLLSLLLSTQMVSPAPALTPPYKEGEPTENITLTQWEFHDLLFHTRSRLGRHNNFFGATYRFLGKIEPLPAIKPRMSEETVELYKPDLSALKVIDIGFTQVLETRKSIRQYGENPINVEQLGEFLYRTARARSVNNSEYGELSSRLYPGGGAMYELSSRPYPGGGAIYELEIYLVVNNCDRLESGLYHYAPEIHQLERLSGKTAAVESLLQDGTMAMKEQGIPQVLVILAARFQRIAWKYESMAYSVILKHVGVLYQTMYLVATAMGIAPCGVGAGNSELFALATGCDYYAETSVGEFALGSKPTKLE